MKRKLFPLLISIFAFLLFISIGILNVPAKKNFSGEYEVNDTKETSSIEISSVQDDNVEMTIKSNKEVLIELTAILNERKEIDFYVDEGVYSGYVEITHVNSADGLVTLNSEFKRKEVDMILAFLFSVFGAALMYMITTTFME